MKKIGAILLLVFVAGCGTSKAVRVSVKDKHAQLYSYVKRMDDADPSNDPTPEQNKSMIRACALDFESLDKILNNWKPSTNMGETTLDTPGTEN
jgi:PBP1b-binding outer membrane lipoprotein LpoB